MVRVRIGVPLRMLAALIAGEHRHDEGFIEDHRGTMLFLARIPVVLERRQRPPARHRFQCRECP